MADKSPQLVLEALQRAVAEPAGLPLYAAKATPGLFATSPVAKKAAQICRDQGYVKTIRTESKGKTAQEICGITEKGLAHLLEQLSPRAVLESFVNALNAREAQFGELLASARETQASLEALKATAEKVLEHLKEQGSQPRPCASNGVAGSGAEHWQTPVLNHLGCWQSTGSLDDCPLPALYRVALEKAPGLTVGQFHDGLRDLHERAHVYLHPWTGPLYEIPEPAVALLVGHEIAYYASLRQS